MVNATLFDLFSFIHGCRYEYIEHIGLLGVCVVDVLEDDWKLACSGDELL
jgi:hypothetical protein